MLPPWGDGLITDWVAELVEYQNASTPDHQPVSINSWIEGILGCRHPQGQSVGPGEKLRRKFSSVAGRTPGYRLSPDHFQKVKRMLAPDWTQKMLCIIVPNRWTVSPEFFLWVRTRQLLSRHSCLVRSPSFPNYWWVEERFGCYQREQFNLYWENSFLTDHNVS